VSRTLEVVATGALALVEDLGRPGLGPSGVGRSGAADRAALRLANRLVANPEGAAAIEVLLGGLAVRAGGPLTVALAGAAAPADVDGTRMGRHAVVDLRTGQVPRLGLTRVEWSASSRSDRIGMRLDGGLLHRRNDAEIASEGMVRGAVQVPPGGVPVVFLADHPVIGGYPVIATVCDADVDRAAQVRPGQGVRFVAVATGRGGAS